MDKAAVETMTAATDNVRLESSSRSFASSDGPVKRFLVGDKVEVRMKEKGLRGSWHPAVVAEVLKGKRVVEYDELDEDDGSGNKLRETVPVGKVSDGDKLLATLPLRTPHKKHSRPYIRPRPPKAMDSGPISWTEGTWVECMDKDAWWEGILAESVSSLVVDDVQSVTRKTLVKILYLEENDLATVEVSKLRIGQEWDEDTGNWSLRGCVPVPVQQPPQKRVRKNDRRGAAAAAAASVESPQQQGQEAAAGVGAATEGELKDAIGTESDVVDDSTLIKISQIVDGFQEQGMALDVPNNSTESQWKQDWLSKNPLPVFSGNEDLGNGPGAHVQEGGVPLGTDALTPEKNESVLDEEAARKRLTDSGWKITKNGRKKAGKVQWTFRSPKSDSTVKPFSTLAAALEFESGGNRGEELVSPPSEGSLKVAVSYSPTKENAGPLSPNGDGELGGKVGDENGEGSSADRGIAALAGKGENVGDEEATRTLLKNCGWTVTYTPRTGRSGQSEWRFKSPPSARKKKGTWFKSLAEAYAEFKKQTETEELTPKGHKGRIPSLRGDNKKGHGSDPTTDAKSEEMPNLKPVLSVGEERRYSDMDDDEPKEVEIMVNSTRKRTVVDQGQAFMRSGSNTPEGSTYQEKPFGTISDFKEEKDVYVIQLDVHGFSKEQVRLIVEEGELVTKAKYSTNQNLDKFSVHCNGTLSSRMVLPKDVQYHLISAELKNRFLTVTIPKRQNAPKDVIQIGIQGS